MIGIMIRVMMGVMSFLGALKFEFLQNLCPDFFFGLLLTKVNSLEEFVVFWEVFFGTCGDFVFTVGGRRTVFYEVKNPVIFRSLPKFWGNHLDFLEKGIELIEKTISHSSWNHGNKKDSPYKKKAKRRKLGPRLYCALENTSKLRGRRDPGHSMIVDGQKLTKCYDKSRMRPSVYQPF